MYLDADNFKNVVATTPLISIDFLVENLNGEILLGRRCNRPAQGYWFVPGGRVRKGETLDFAFERQIRSELGVGFSRSQAMFLGVYEHFYNDSIFEPDTLDETPSTHYIVLGYHLRLEHQVEFNFSKKQHDQYRWWSMAQISESKSVHINAKAYLDGLKDYLSLDSHIRGL